MLLNFIKKESLKERKDRGNKEKRWKIVFDALVFYSLAALIGISFIPFGTVDPWIKSIFCAGICLLAGLRTCHGLLNGGFRIVERALLIPPLLIALQALLQMFFASATQGEVSGFSRFATLDFYGTKSFLVTLVVLILTAEMLFHYVVTVKRLAVLVWLVLLTAGLSAVFGLLRIWWFDQSDSLIFFDPGEGFAQFINRNHWMYLVEMAVGLTVGLLLNKNLSEKQRFGGWVLTALLLLAGLNANSRGGLISLTVILVSGVFYYFFVERSAFSNDRKYYSPRKRNARKRLLPKILTAFLGIVLVFSGIVLTVAFVGGEATVVRFEKMETEFDRNDGQQINRLKIWKATTALISERPLIGSGLGAYTFSITRFDDTAGGSYKLKQAHNEYLELAAGGGLLSLLIVIVWAGLFANRVRQTMNTDDIWRKSVCIGAVLGIIGVMLHNIVDFGLRPLSNALLFVVLIVMAAARIDAEENIRRQL